MSWSQILSILVVIPALASCAISTPYRVKKESPPDAQVVVSFTRVALDQKKRSVFDSYVKEIASTLDQQTGLLGYSLRREVFGNQAWTVTVWESDEALMRFVNSQLHTEAMEKSEPSVVGTDFVRKRMKSGDIPVPWTEIVEMFQARRREVKETE
jgi:heme-degrading monooxygenase HmoA